MTIGKRERDRESDEEIFKREMGKDDGEKGKDSDA